MSRVLRETIIEYRAGTGVPGFRDLVPHTAHVTERQKPVLPCVVGTQLCTQFNQQIDVVDINHTRWLGALHTDTYVTPG